MIGRPDTVVIDCPDPAALAEFYAELLGLPVTRRDDDWFNPQQFHLDVEVDDIEIAEQQVLTLGAERQRATRVPAPRGDHARQSRTRGDHASHHGHVTEPQPRTTSRWTWSRWRNTSLSGFPPGR